MSIPHIEPGRCYYEKRVGYRWEIWFCRSDSSADPASGATEWKAVSTRFWRWKTAARISNEIWCAFNDGVWVANCRHVDAAAAKSSPAQDQAAHKESDGGVVADTRSNETATDLMAQPSPMVSRSCDVKITACGVAGVAPGPSEAHSSLSQAERQP